MAREYHYLSRGAGGKCPKRFLVLGTELSTSPKCKQSGRSMAVLDRFALLENVRKGDSYSTGDVAGGFDADNAIEALSAMLKAGKMVDVWARDCLMALGSIGFWRAVDKGIFMFKRGSWNGTAVTTDPPVILICYAKRQEAYIRFLDVANICPAFGENEHEAYEQALAVGGCLADWFATVEREGLGTVSATVASQAMKAYRRRFLSHPVLCHNNKQALRLEEDAICQGRTECYQLGKVNGPVYQLDVQSAYPSLAAAAEFPARLRRMAMVVSCDEVRRYSDKFCVIATASVETDQPDYPCRHNGITIYPVGRFTTTLCGGELQHAISTGRVSNIQSCAVYDGERLFSTFAHWAMGFRRLSREAGDSGGELLAKTITNALWGGFARQNRSWQNRPDGFSDSRWCEWWTPGSNNGNIEHWRSFAGLVQMRESGGFTDDAVPAITAWVAMLGRCLLHEILDCASVGKVYYCATDSVFCDDVAYFALCNGGWVKPGTPGKMKLVDVHDWMVLRGIHNYSVPGRIVASGVPLDATGEGGSGRDWHAGEKVSSALKRGETPAPNIVPKRRGFSEVYRHGTIDSVGKVSPIVLNQWS